jgi:hypothetical protein
VAFAVCPKVISSLANQALAAITLRTPFAISIPARLMAIEVVSRNLSRRALVILAAILRRAQALSVHCISIWADLFLGAAFMAITICPKILAKLACYAYIIVAPGICRTDILPAFLMAITVLASSIPVRAASVSGCVRIAKAAAHQISFAA